MTTWIRHGLIVLACVVVLASSARTQEDNPESSDGGPSRAELFALRLRAEQGLEVALSAAAAPPFVLPTNVKGDAIFGIDVSHHNDENCKCKPGDACAACKIDWSRIRDQKVLFVYAKASQGKTARDPTFEYHWRTLGQNGIKRGAYHFMSADADPIAQADNFVDRLEAAENLQSTDLPPCLDLESDVRKDAAKRWIVDPETGKIKDFWSGQDPDKILEKVTKFLTRVEERTGRIPIVYTSHGWWAERIRDETKIAKLQRHLIWIANYTGSGSPVNGKPKVPNGQAWALWQFTETGRISDPDVAAGAFDINVFNGNLGAFEQALGVAAPEKKEIANLDQPKEDKKASEQIVTPNSANEQIPADHVTGTNPGESKEAKEQPKEPAKAPEQVVSPNTPNETKPPEQVASINPNAPHETKPADQLTGSTPDEAKETPKPPDQTVNPNAPSESSKTSSKSRLRNSRAAEAKVPAENAPADKAATEKNAADKAERMMIEIVLGNGRVLRVDANIDPTVLARLVSAIDGK